MKWHIVIGCLLAVSLIVFWFVQTMSTKTSNIDDAKNTSESVITTRVDGGATLVILPQSNTEKIVVNEAVLTVPGYVVVREVIGDTAGQIVEISSYLDAGTYSNIEIPLGEFYTGENELMVLVYADAGGDKVLNDLDQPFVDTKGDFVARLVATGEVVSNEIIESKPDGIPLMMMGMGMPTITYTNEGFQPATLEVGVGAMVHFVNESDTEMWVASDSHPAHDILPTFDQFKTGDMFMYIFEEPGTWEYHDHLNPTAVGEIIVK